MPQTLDQFNNAMKDFDYHRETAIKEMKEMKYCITTKNPKKNIKKRKRFVELCSK